MPVQRKRGDRKIALFLWDVAFPGRGNPESFAIINHHLQICAQ